MPALDWVTSDQVALKVVEYLAASSAKSAEGIINSDTEVTGEEVVQAETATETVGIFAIETAGCTSNESVKLNFTGAEQVILNGSDDDFLGIGRACERGRCGSQNNCEECEGFFHVYIGLFG